MDTDGMNLRNKNNLTKPCLWPIIDFASGSQPGTQMTKDLAPSKCKRYFDKQETLENVRFYAIARPKSVRAWRNGRRARLRIWCLHGVRVQVSSSAPKVASLWRQSSGTCGSSSVVECHLAKVDVASSNLVYRSTFAKRVRWSAQWGCSTGIKGTC